MAVSKEQIEEEIADLSRRYSAAQDAGDVNACRWYYDALLSLSARMMSDGGFYPQGGLMRIPMPAHLTLGQVIERLREEPNQSKIARIGFRNPHSYRGYYNQLAFEVAENVPVSKMLADAESSLGRTFEGWKGGDYTMSEYTDTWLVLEEGMSQGETLGAILLEYMLST